MSNDATHSLPSVRNWRRVQSVVWAAGAATLVALVVAPGLGLHAFWNVLIPAAPALVALAPGLWRNICPLASTALFARHVGVSRRRRVPRVWQDRFLLGGVAILFLLVPLRHVTLDTSGPGTALVIALLALAAVTMGVLFEWKSGWCSGLCPVHPVEKLYGQGSLASLPNAHCIACERCVAPCPDSTPGVHPLSGSNGGATRRLAGVLMVGAFPGFIWGWFQVPDYVGGEGWRHLDTAYAFPLGGAVVTLATCAVAQRMVHDRWHPVLTRTFACAAIACYYWYRLPALFGFGPFPGDGMLLDLRGFAPPAFTTCCRALTTGLLVWLLLGRRGGNRAWTLRPPLAPSDASTPL